ncbi:MAG: tetratricopeptide repeat protein [Verrucomicrobiales bacterium]|nr:tetratricopeptide repeat protein [Verrucomicrobiales bacterium]
MPDSGNRFRHRRIGPLLSAGILFLAIAITFREAPFLGFSDYDDPLVVQAPEVRDGLSAEGFTYAFTSTVNNLWQPLTWLSHQLDFQIFGDWAGGHHLTSVLIHFAASLLLFSWLKRHTRRDWLALATALIFAIHPLRVESVIWIAERKDVLSAFFYLLAIWFYSEWTTGEGGKKLRRLYLFSFAAACLGALAKPSLVTLPVALVLIDFWPLRRPVDWKKSLIEKGPFFLLAIVVSVVTWQVLTGDQFFGGDPGTTLWQRLVIPAATVASYIVRTFWPVDLAPVRPYPSPLPVAASFVASTILLVLLIAGIALVRKGRAERFRWFGIGVLWFLGLLFPVSGIVTFSDNFAPDRYAYLAQIGLIWIVVWAVAKWERAGTIILGLAICALSILTTRQVGIWRTPETLWQHTLGSTDADRNYIAHHQLGLHFAGQEKVDEAVRHLESAARAAPGFPVPVANLALVQARSGNIEKALATFKKTGPDLPQRDRFIRELIAAILAAGGSEEAVPLYQELLISSSDDPAIRIDFGHVLYAAGQFDAALQRYREAAEMAPASVEAKLNLGAMLLKTGEIKPAISTLNDCVKLVADGGGISVRVHRSLAQAHLLDRNYTAAIENYEKALSQAGDSADPALRNELAQLLLDSPKAALRDPARALKLTLTIEAGDNPRFLRTLARAYAANNQPDEAKSAAIRGLKAVSKLLQTDPLPKPWTRAELENLEAFFRSHVG